MREAPTLVTRAVHRSTIAVTELKCDQRNFGMTAPIPPEEAYLIGLQLLPCLDHDLYFEGRFVRPTNWFSGALTIYDLRRSPIADIRDPYHCLMFHLPRTGLEAVAQELGSSGIDDLRHRPGAAVDDPTARHLLSSLLPAVARPAEAPSLFLDHVAVALTAHIAHTYGGLSVCKPVRRSVLAPHLERRAKELMMNSLHRDISLIRLAAECGLSPRHFSRTFRASTGVSPHRWLMQQRVKRAQELLRDGRKDLAEVALTCGFADQSHFTRVFTTRVGVAPGAWRRMAGNSDEQYG